MNFASIADPTKVTRHIWRSHCSFPKQLGDEPPRQLARRQLANRIRPAAGRNYRRPRERSKMQGILEVYSVSLRPGHLFLHGLHEFRRERPFAVLNKCPHIGRLLTGYLFERRRELGKHIVDTEIVPDLR